MSDDLNRRQRQLEQATARGEVDPAQMDAETAALREAWIALGRLLPAPEPVQLKAPAEWQVAARVRRPWFRAPLVAWTVSAAVCVVVAWSGWHVGRERTTGRPAAQTASSAPAKPLTQLAGEVAVGKRAATAAKASKEPQWDDALDERLTRLNQRVIRVQQDWTSQAVAHAVSQYEWERVRRDLSGDSL
jgi:hypothetical protein